MQILTLFDRLLITVKYIIPDEMSSLSDSVNRIFGLTKICYSRWNSCRKPPFKMNRQMFEWLANGCMWTWLTLILPAFMFDQTWTSAILCKLRMRRGREPRFTPIEVPNDELP